MSPARRPVKGRAKAKPTVETKRDVAPVRKVPAGKARKPTPAPLVVKDTLDPTGSTAAQLLKKLRDERHEFRPATAKKVGFGEEDFMEFFGAEIERELARPAYIHHDRYARWPCQCCDAIIPVPRRTTVFHGDYILEHDDILGLLVNGERWIPKAETPIQVVQPGRLRNPWTGKTLEGRDLGTTGVYES
ncbi:MAG: hypothetical protein AABX89_02075 [Candidatus Thermoplasmatota archaeon]